MSMLLLIAFLRLFYVLIGFDAIFLQLIAERDRLNKDLEQAHGYIKQLEADLDHLQVNMYGGRGTNRR